MHTIRLRGPWKFNVLADFSLSNADSADLPTGTVKMPTDWGASLGMNFHGRVGYRRKFNCPTGLENGAHVTLCVAAVDCLAEVAINDHVLGQMRGDQSDRRFEITSHLRPTNVLTIVVELPTDLENAPRPAGRENSAGGLIGEVRLEIAE